jgi:colanic acid/amylovoran biosynthesis glycosyltransferase
MLSGPVITSFYGYDVTRHWQRDGYRELFKLGDSFIALSETMKHQLLSIGAPPDRTMVHRLGVDVARFDRKRRPEGRSTNIISIARLVEKKGIEFGIRAVAKAAREIPELAYTIVGDGPLRPSLEQLTARLNLERRVRFLGARSQAEIEELLSRSHILLAPSVTAVDGDTEGTPVAILEAQAARIPVISTKHSGIPEVVEDSVSGYLVEERDVDALTGRIRELAGDESQQLRMGEAGRQFVMQHHDIHRLNDELAQVYARMAHR